MIQIPGRASSAKTSHAYARHTPDHRVRDRVRERVWVRVRVRVRDRVGAWPFCCPSQSSQSFVCVHHLRFKKNDLTLSWEETIVKRSEIANVRGNR